MRDRLIFRLLFAFLLTGVLPVQAPAEELETLARGFWDWRAVAQPLSGDDIPRIERPVHWTRDWSAEAVEKRRQILDGNVPIALQRWESLDLRDEIERIGRLGAN